MANIIKNLGKVINDATIDAENMFWYRRKMDKSGYEVLESTLEETEVAGAGTVIKEFDGVGNAEQFIRIKQRAYVAKATIAALIDDITQAAILADGQFNKTPFGIACATYCNEAAIPENTIKGGISKVIIAYLTAFKERT